MRLALIIVGMSVTFSLGCGGSGGGTNSGGGGGTGDPATSVTGNWQIETTYGSGSVGPLLLGSLVQTGSNVQGVLRFINLDSQSPCNGTFQTLQFGGSVSSDGLMSLQSNTFGVGGAIVSVSLQLASTAHSFNRGTMSITGGVCGYPSSPAVGVQIALVTGQFTGTLLLDGSIPGAINGTTSLTLTQSNSPSSDGEFPVSGELTFTGSSCYTDISMSGTVSGEQLQLTSTTNPVGVLLSGNPSTDARQLQNLTLTFNQGACSTAPPYNVYVGSADRQ